MVKKNKEGYPIVKWNGIEVPHYWHIIAPRSEINRIYAIASYTTEKVFNSISVQKRRKMFKRLKQLKKSYYWGGPKKPFFIKKK